MGVGANSAQLSFKGVELSPILSQISLPWQRGSIRVNINDTVKLADSENRSLEPKITSRSYDSLKHRLIFPIGAIVIFFIFL